MAFAAPVLVGMIDQRGGAGATQVAVRTVEQVLVRGVGVDRGHQALDDAELVGQRLGHAGQAVRRARRVGDDVLGGRVVVLVVDTHDEGAVLVGGRGRDDDLLGATVDVGVRLGGVGEEAGRLDDDVGAHVAPGDVGGVLLGEDLDGGATDGDRVLREGDVVGEHAEHRVVLEQVGDALVVHQVVGGDDFDVGTGRLDGPEEVAADAAEAVDPYANGHGMCCLPLDAGRATGPRHLGVASTLDLSRTASSHRPRYGRVTAFAWTPASVLTALSSAVDKGLAM